MGPDEEKKLRQLLLQKRQLPEPDWNLFARTTKRFSRAAKKEEKPIIKLDGKVGERDKKR